MPFGASWWSVCMHGSPTSFGHAHLHAGQGRECFGGSYYACVSLHLSTIHLQDFCAMHVLIQHILLLRCYCKIGAAKLAPWEGLLCSETGALDLGSSPPSGRPHRCIVSVAQQCMAAKWSLASIAVSNLYGLSAPSHEGTLPASLSGSSCWEQLPLHTHYACLHLELIYVMMRFLFIAFLSLLNTITHQFLPLLYIGVVSIGHQK